MPENEQSDRSVMPRPTKLSKKMMRRQVAASFTDSDAMFKATIPLLKLLANISSNDYDTVICPICEHRKRIIGTETCIICASDIAQSILDELPLARGVQ